jgi:drug/metabolite transporter (DMT)-like permease
LFGNAYLLLTLTMLSWGGNAVAGRMAVGEVSPMALTMLRWAGVAVLLALFARRPVRTEWPVLRRHLPFLFALGLIGFTIFNALFYVAAHSTAAINIGIIQGSIPVFVLLGAYAAYRTPVTGLQTAGVAVTMIGVVLVAAQGDVARLAELAFNKGDLLMVLACLLYAGYTVALRKRPAVSGLAMFSVMAACALLTTVPLVAAEAVLGTLVWPTPKGWAILGFVSLFPSFLAQIFFLRSVELVGPGRAGLFVNLVPIFSALLAVLILGERFQLYHALALVLVLVGIALAERLRRA